MNLSDQATLDIRNELTSLIPWLKIKTKSVFNGYGLFVDGDMFGIFYQDEFYLRAEQELAKELEEYSYKKYMAPQNSINTHIQYFFIPELLRNNHNKFKYFIENSLQQIKQQKQNKQAEFANKLRSLPNLNIKHERLLAKIGISSVPELRNIGAETAYIELKKIGIPVTLNLYWNLYAGLQNKNVLILKPEEKKSSLNKLNQILKEHNLRDEQWSF